MVERCARYRSLSYGQNHILPIRTRERPQKKPRLIRQSGAFGLFVPPMILRPMIRPRNVNRVRTGNLPLRKTSGVASATATATNMWAFHIQLKSIRKHGLLFRWTRKNALSNRQLRIDRNIKCLPSCAFPPKTFELERLPRPRLSTINHFYPPSPSFFSAPSQLIYRQAS